MYMYIYIFNRKAYDLLSSIELNNIETDFNNVLLLIKTQNIIYRRFPSHVNDQKYPAYEDLISVLLIPQLILPPKLLQPSTTAPIQEGVDSHTDFDISARLSPKVREGSPVIVNDYRNDDSDDNYIKNNYSNENDSSDDKIASPSPDPRTPLDAITADLLLSGTYIYIHSFIFAYTCINR
jgi:hypothetical protein